MHSDRSIAQEQADQVRRTTGATLAARALEEVLPALGKGYSPQETRKAAAKMSKDMEPGFTPGPWYAYSPLASGVHAGHHYKVANSKPCGIVEDEDGSWVPDFPDWCAESRIICTTTDDELSRANARLIAAAPDLYDALAECVSEPGAMCWDDPEAAYRRLRAINDLARAALARAKGGAA